MLFEVLYIRLLIIRCYLLANKSRVTCHIHDASLIVFLQIFLLPPLHPILCQRLWKLFCPIIHKTQGFPNKTLGFQLQNPGFCHKTLGFASKTLGFDTKPRVLWTKPRVFTTKPWVLFCYVYMFQNPGFHHKTLGFTLKYKIFCPKYNLTKIHSF